MCPVPKGARVLQILALAVWLGAILSYCNGADPTAGYLPACKRVSVPLKETARTCHSVGTDECTYITTETYTYIAVGYECNKKEK